MTDTLLNLQCRALDVGYSLEWKVGKGSIPDGTLLLDCGPDDYGYRRQLFCMFDTFERLELAMQAAEDLIACEEGRQRCPDCNANLEKGKTPCPSCGDGGRWQKKAVTSADIPKKLGADGMMTYDPKEKK